jgi:hypothetical protein
VRSLKDFEIHGVHKKEPASNGQKSYQSDRQDHLHEVLRQDGMIMLSVAVSDRHLSKPSVRSEVIKK